MIAFEPPFGDEGGIEKEEGKYDRAKPPAETAPRYVFFPTFLLFSSKLPMRYSYGWRYSRPTFHGVL